MIQQQVDSISYYVNLKRNINGINQQSTQCDN